MTVREIVERVLARLAVENGGRDLTGVVTPIVQATLVELDALKYLALSTEEES